MNRKILFILLALCLVLSACGQERKVDREYSQGALKVGVIAPLSGFVSVLGERVKSGLEMALGKIDQQEKKIELTFEDGKCIDPKTTVGAYNKLVDMDSVNYIFGPLCVETTKAVFPLLSEDLGVVLFPLGAISQHAVLGGERVFSFVFNIEKEDSVLAELAYNNLKAKTAALLGGNTVWGIKHKEYFTKYFEGLGGKVVAQESYRYGETDFRTQFLKIKKAEVDVVYVIENGDAILPIYEQIAEIGIESNILAQYTLEHPDVLNAPKDLLARTFYSWPINKDMSPGQKEFFGLYKEKYGTHPEILALSAYDGLMVFYQAWEECGGARGCIIEEIRNLKNHPGMSGEFSINEYGEAEREFVIKTVRNGEFVYYK